MRIFMIVLIAFFIIPQNAFAMDFRERLYDESEVSDVVEAVPDEYKEIVISYDFWTGKGIDKIYQSVKHLLFSTAKGQIDIIWDPAINTVYVIVFCGIISSFISQKNYSFLILLTGSIVIIYMNLCDAKSLFTDSIQAIQAIYDFSTVLLPCLAGASAFAGATISSGVKYTAAALVMNILLNFSNTILVPMVSLYLVCVIGDCIFGQSVLGMVSGFIHWVTKKILTWSVILFTTFLTVSGMITGTGELLTVRFARTTIANGLPIVGKIVSDTASTLVAGAATLRNSVGLFGMLAVICILVVPLTSVGVRYFLFKIVGKFASLYPEKRFSLLIDGISEAYGMLLAIIGTGFIMLFLTILSFLHLSGAV